jgi:hypothetical protein
MSQVDVPDEYSTLKQPIGTMKWPNLPALETILPVANTLKSVIAGEPQEWSNNAHVAYNTGWINDVSGGIVVSVLQQQASRRDWVLTISRRLRMLSER